MDVHRLNAQFVDWASQQAKPGRWLHAGEAEVFFDDTEIEVEGHKFEGARINYEGHRALDRKSTRLNSSHLGISYAVFCLKKNKQYKIHSPTCPQLLLTLYLNHFPISL